MELEYFDDEESDENEKNQQPETSNKAKPEDHVKVIEKKFLGYTSKTSSGLFHIQYFKYIFRKYVINESETDIREKGDLCFVTAEVDGHS